LHHKHVVEKFSGQVFEFIPGFTARVEAEELFDRILDGIKGLSIKKDNLIAENRDLHLAIAKKSKDKHDIEGFCAAAGQWFPQLQKKYEVCKVFLSSYPRMNVPCHSWTICLGFFIY
jgi:hypothetical protein